MSQLFVNQTWHVIECRPQGQLLFILYYSPFTSAQNQSSISTIFLVYWIYFSLLVTCIYKCFVSVEEMDWATMERGESDTI